MCASAPQPSPPPAKPPLKALYVAVLVGAAALYGLTCQRGVSWQDSGMFQFRALRCDLGAGGQLGLALAHPLYVLAGSALRHIPIGGLPLWLNLFSGVGMAVALANLAAACAVLTGRRSVGAAVAAMLALAHTPWWLATVAEVYTWSLAGLTGELWLLVSLVRRPAAGKLAALALLNGLGLCLHNVALLPLPVYLGVAAVLSRRGRIPRGALPAAGGMYLLGAGLYIAMTVAKAVETGSLSLAVGSALFGEYRSVVLTAGPVGSKVAANFALVGLNLLNVLLPLALIGAWVLRRRVGGVLAWALGSVAVIHVLFAVRYFVPDQFTFFLPTYALMALLAAVGLDALLARGAAWRRAAWAGCAVSLVAMPTFYALTPAAAGRLLPSAAGRKRTLPFRDEARYWIIPWKHNEDSARRFARAALGSVEPDAVIIADPTAYYPLAVARLAGGGGGSVTLLGGHETWPMPMPADDVDAFLSAVGDRPLYVVSPLPGYCPEALLARTTPEPAGVLYRLTRR